MATKPLTDEQKQRRLEAGRRYRARNRELLNERARARRAAGNDAAWVTNLRQKYNLTPEDYAAMLVEQKGVCAICDQPETAIQRGKVRRLCVDHCHTTGKVRGLLCQRCNAMLGQALDNPDTLISGVAYLLERG